MISELEKAEYSAKSISFLSRDKEESDRLIGSIENIKSVLVDQAFDSSDDNVRDSVISFLHDLNDVVGIIKYISENKLINN